MKSKNRCFDNIAKLVKEYRLRHPDNISQAELSNLLGYKNGQFVSNVERGICAIPLKALGDLQKTLNIPRNELISAMGRDYEETIVNYLEEESGKSSSQESSLPNGHDKQRDDDQAFG